MNIMTIASKIRQTLTLTACAILVLYSSLATASANKEGIQIYQQNLRLSETHKQNLADAVSRYRNADNIWDVLRENFTMYHYESHPLVQEKIEWYMNNQDFLLRSASRAAPYMYYILQQVKKRQLPAELVLLPIIESGYNPFAMSSAGASGIWQMMPQTAKGLGIRQDRWFDGRRDIIASTRGALNYLAYLQSFFDGNWMLAIAAYNTGEGNVLAAIRRNIQAGKDTSFWSLPVAQQTKDYVPSLLALATIISHPDRYPIYFPPVRNAQYLAQVDLRKKINLKKVAKYAGISYEKLLHLNPGYRNAETASGPFKIILPIENVEQFSENYLRFSPSGGPVHWVHYSVQPGDTLSSIAKRFNTNVSHLRKVNRLKENAVRLGAVILIPETNDAGQLGKQLRNTEHQLASSQTTSKPNRASLSAMKKKASNLASKAVGATKRAFQRQETSLAANISPNDTLYMVRTNDTLTSISRRFHVSRSALIAKNGLEKLELEAGQQLIIPTGKKVITLEKTKSIKRENNLQPGDTIYMVRQGDSLNNIAARYKISPASIRLVNAKSSNELKVGEKLILPTHISG